MLQNFNGVLFPKVQFFPMSHITSSLLIINCFLMCQVSIPHLRWYDKFRLTALTFFQFFHILITGTVYLFRNFR